MIWIRRGAWNGSSSRWFRQERIYWKGYKWTPFVRVRWRKYAKETTCD